MTRTPQPCAALAAVALLLAVPACHPSQAEDGQPLAQELRRRDAAKVRVAPIEVREMVRTLSTTTNVESENEIEILPRRAGVVEEVRAEEGDRVEADAVLCVLDQREARAAVAEAEVALQEARDGVKRLELAVDEAAERAERAKLAWAQSVREVTRNEKAGLLSEVDLDKLRLTRDTNERDWQAAVIAHKSAQQELANQATVIERAALTVERETLALSYTEVKAPFAGVVAQRSVKVGDAVTAAQAAFTLTDADRLRAVVYRPQRELAFFQGADLTGDGRASGDEVEIQVRPEAIPGTVYGGSIRFLSPTIDPGSGSFRVTIDLEQPDPGAERPRLMPGMLIRLDIVTERHPQALVVPKRALRREGEAYSVFVVRDGKAAQVAVREDFSDDESVEVHPLEEGALHEGDLVVVVGNRDLEDGAEVQVESEPAEGEGTAASKELADAPTAADGAGSTGEAN